MPTELNTAFMIYTDELPPARYKSVEAERVNQAHAKALPSCIGNCNQGQGLCVTPEECKVPLYVPANSEERSYRIMLGVVFGLLVALVALAVIVGVAV